MSTEFYWIAVMAVVVLSSARITRLFVYDDFPPIAKPRAWFKVRTEGSDWGLLAKCGFCMSFWVTTAVVILGDLSGVFDRKPVAAWMTPAWWFVFGTLAASYLAASYIARDGDK